MITVKRYNPDAAMSISREHAWMRETPEGGHVEYGDYASLFSQFETVKAERDAQQKRADALAVESIGLRHIAERIVNALYAAGYEPEENSLHPWKSLIFDAEKALETPVTSAALSTIRDKYRAEGINFAANRLLAAFEHGFIDKPAGEVADVAKMILSAVTELPDAPEEDFTSDYSDEVIALIRAELSEAK